MSSVDRSRCRLHLNKLDEFAAFCEADGWTREPVVGDYEVLRLRKPGVPAVIAYKRADAKEHATIFGTGTQMFNRYMRAKRAAR